jgi:hypothetical protein
VAFYLCLPQQLRVRLQEFHHFGGLGGSTLAAVKSWVTFSTARSASCAERIAGSLNDNATPGGWD